MESNKRKRNETEENSEQQQKSGHEQTAVGDKRVRSTKPQKAFKYSPNYIECPKCWDEKEEEEEEGSQAKGKKHPSLTIFLAGGISNCPNWQKIAARWEHEHLHKAMVKMFWFPSETLCPITLYELGVWTILSQQNQRPLFVGTHPQYQRKVDVSIQTELAYPQVKVRESLDDVLDDVIAWYNQEMAKRT